MKTLAAAEAVNSAVGSLFQSQWLQATYTDSSGFHFHGKLGDLHMTPPPAAPDGSLYLISFLTQSREAKHPLWLRSLWLVHWRLYIRYNQSLGTSTHFLTIFAACFSASSDHSGNFFLIHFSICVATFGFNKNFPWVIFCCLRGLYLRQLVE